MRIISGKYRGLTLASVGKGDKDAHLRPTSDRVRESIFNLLLNGGYDDPVNGARVLDLFAGTGALGLEALSRGAKFACFFDDGSVAGRLIRQNINLCQQSENTKLNRRNALRMGTCSGPEFDLVFCDPPYGKALGEKALVGAARSGWLAANALIVWEENAQQIAPLGFEMLDARRYGDSWVHVLTFTG